jgi:hypothetical protein
VFEIDEEVEGGADYPVRARALDVGDEANAARVVFFTGAVKAPLVSRFHAVFPTAETLLEGMTTHNKSAINL